MQSLEKVVPRKRTQIDIRISPEVKERIKIAAYMSGISVSEYVRRLLIDRADKVIEEFENRTSRSVEL